VVDASGDFVRYNERLLLTSVSLSVEEVSAGVVERGGLCIAAHVDRPAYSLLANLGFVPPDVSFAAMEISRYASAEATQQRNPSLAGRPLISSGDAHRLEEMSDRTIFTLNSPTVPEIALAFRGQENRRVKVLAP
jgi:hypothetical protein